MTRLFLAIWLAAFAVQTTELLAVVVPDDCTEQSRGSASDLCPDACPRCVCCARVHVFVPQISDPARTDGPARPSALPPSDAAPMPVPRDIFHIPKTL